VGVGLGVIGGVGGVMLPAAGGEGEKKPENDRAWTNVHGQRRL
jgi:hypothetical protein